MSDEVVPLERTGNAIRRMIRQHGRFPADLRKSLRPRMKAAGQPVLADARRRAGWSTRIPRALRLATSFTKKQAGVSIVVSKAKAPHARPHEGITGNRTFRHPVHGNRNVWVEQSTRPFLVPAADMHGRRVVEAVNQAVDEAARAAGYGK
ncbi:HK97 gp10 family phage protein [Nocardiopsis ganjiahuensis]|uniref:HK97 gp10 family phage protein n=1 Tax=Nocardiopsis ganjiahuensis TaxID=239984 RepID=UPI00034935A9|nr:HK97 gp10 family phage protein [Nocardiopsis ganjiahuensis]